MADIIRDGAQHILVDGKVVNTDNPMPFEYGDSAAIDPVARLRVSQGQTIFDYKQTNDKVPLYFDETITDVSGNAASTHVPADAAVTMHVETGDQIIRQTFRRFNHQPGKGQNVLLTGSFGGGGAGVVATIGLNDGNDGLMFAVIGTTINVAKRKGGVDTIVEQNDWNLDKLDGTGPSGVTLDISKAQVFSIDFQWLGMGRVRFGMFFDGIVVYCHEFVHSNVDTSVFMSTPNLPIRYVVQTTDATVEMSHICSSVISEGGEDARGVIRYFSTNGTHVDADVADTIYAVVGLRLKTTHIDVVTIAHHVSLLTETNDDFEWLLILDPVVAGTFTYGDETNSSLQTARGATANTVTGGTIVSGGFIAGFAAASPDVFSPLYLGSFIDGTPQTLVLCVRPLTTLANINGGIAMRELL